MEPPDDPGGTIPYVSHFVTVDPNNEDSMDTDSSLSQNETNKSYKRKRVSSWCPHCNKKRRKRGDGSNNKTKASDCQCIFNKQESFKIPQPIQENISKPSTSVKENFITLETQVDSQPLQSRTPISVARLLYQSSDAAPYTVHVQKIQLSPDDNVILHPITFGRFLKKNAFKNIINGSVKRIGRNRISVDFSDFRDANDFLNSETLITHNFKAFIPSFSVTRMGIIRGVPVDWSDEEIKENITVPIGCGPILKVRRLRRKINIEGKVELKVTETVVITFDGQILPKRVYACYTSLPVDLYIFPTIQCYHCCRFGHVKSQCRSKPRCYRCGQGHTGEHCSVNEEDITCCLCNGYHSATSRNCLEYERQRNIKESMAKSCISYAEASKLHAPISRISYADALLSSNSISTNQCSPNLSQNNNVPLSQPVISYKKTVFSKPRFPAKTVKGYDIATHRNLTRDYDMPAPANGCAIINKENNDLSKASVTDLIIALINLLSQSSKPLPSNAATVNDALSLLSQTNINNGQISQGYSMELPKSNN